MSKNLTPRYIIIGLVLAWALLTLWPSIKYQQLSPEDIQYMRETGTLEDLENKIIDVVIVDNGSTDGSSDFVEKKFKDIKVLRLDKNLGYSKGYNKGIQEAIDSGSKYILISNNDVFLKYKTKVLNGTFRFGKNYNNNILIYLKNKSIEVNRVFSPPDNTNLEVQITKHNRTKTIHINQDNCFENYFLEVIKNIKKKRYTFYLNRMIKDENFRFKLLNSYSKIN